MCSSDGTTRSSLPENGADTGRDTALRETGERLVGLWKAMPGGVAVIGADGTIVEVNDAACSILGVSRGQCVGRVLDGLGLQMVSEDGQALAIGDGPVMRAFTTGRAVRDIVMGFYAADPQQCRWLLFNAEPMLEPESGMVRETVVTFQDITDRNRAEAALRESEERFRTAFDSAPIGMSLTAPDGTLLKVNRALCEILGRTEQELVGGNMAAVTHPDDVGMTRGVMTHMVESGEQVTRFHKRFVHADGRVVLAELNSLLLRDAEGRPLHFVTHIQDVTEREHAVIALRESESRFREMTDILPDMVVELDPELRVTYINRAVTHVLGYTQADIGAGVGLRDALQPEDLARAVDALVAEAATGRSRVGVYSLRRKDGTLVPTEIHSMRVVGPDGQLLGYRGVMRDITDRQHMEDAQRLAAVGQLASGVAHEFNNILASMVLQAEFATEGGGQEQYEKLADLVFRGGLRGGEICRDLMAFARPGEPKRDDLAVETVVEASLAVAARQIGNAGIEVVRDYGTFGHGVRGDAKRLQQVVLNLVINACQAMPEGGRLTIGTRFTESGEGQPSISMTISDTGTGIAPEHLHRIFEPFFSTKGLQGSGTSSGTGLGLSVSLGIVRAHGGRIDVSSEPGRGTTFRIVLPTAELRPTADGDDGETPRAEKRRTARILVAEDREELADLLEASLTGDGHTVVSVTSTSEALSRMRTATFDLVITDLLMPGGGGSEVLAATKGLPEPPPVLVISGVLEEDVEAEVLSAGAAAFLRKPFTREQLTREVGRLLAETPS